LRFTTAIPPLEMDKHPVEFCPTTHGEVYSSIATKPEEAVYLRSTPLKPYINMMERGEYNQSIIPR